MKRTRRRNPAASSCWDPWGCRTSVTLVRSSWPERGEDKVEGEGYVEKELASDRHLTVTGTQDPLGRL